MGETVGMVKGLHDNSSLYPLLPGRECEQAEIDEYAPIGSEFRAAWEFKLSHALTQNEGSAFWHGVNIQHESGQRLRDAARAIEQAWTAFVEDDNLEAMAAAIAVLRDALGAQP